MPPPRSAVRSASILAAGPVAAGALSLVLASCGPIAIGAGLSAAGGGGTTTTIAPVGPTVPAVPSALSGQATGPSSVSLSWQDSSDNEDGFRLERSSGGLFELVAELPVDSTAFQDSALLPATAYAYRVQAFNAQGFSNFSAQLPVTTPDQPPPTAPTQLQAAPAGTTAIDVSWIDNSDEEDSIRIERADIGAFELLTTLPADTASFRDTGLLPNTNYRYQVQAVAGSRFSAYSNEANATTLATPPPVLDVATAMAASSSPVAGEVLVLFLSNDVTLQAGTLLTDDDLTIANGTLGSVVEAPVLVNPRLVQVTLGVGVSLTPGVTTLTFSPDNDAVLGAGGVPAQPGPPRPLTVGDGNAPTIDNLTLNGITDALNGTGPAGGTLQVPTSGFTIRVRYSDASSPLAPSATTITSSTPVTVGLTPIPPGQSFTSFLSASSNTGQTVFTVPASVRFSPGPVTLTVFVRDISGMTSAPAQFSFRCKQPTDVDRPFETGVNALQLWYLDTSRDLENYTIAGSNTFQVQAGANGRPDFEDLLLLLGLFGPNTAVNDLVRTRLRQDIAEQLVGLFPGVNIAFTFTSPGAWPSPAPNVPYAAAGFSQMCLGGASDLGTGTLVLAQFDPNNSNQENDCLTDFFGVRLGVFPATLVAAGIQPPPSSLFRLTFDPLRPSGGGAAIGTVANDPERLTGAVSDARAATIENALTSWARAIAVLTAAACGQSMGLVKDGAMPGGLYGGDPVNFPGSTSGTIRDPDFPIGAANVMSPTLSFASIVNPATGFNTLNLAYLREQVLCDF